MKKPSLKKLDGIRSNKSLWIIIIVVILIIAALPSYYYYNQYQKAKVLLQNPDTSANVQVKDLISKIGKLIELPTGETPTIATVSDITKLAGQPFFANAKNGDKVLIFTQAKEAILYRESIDKIIQVAPINLGSSASPAANLSNQLTPTVVPVTVAIYNGTTTVGLAAKADSTITQGVSNASITQKGDAKGNYLKTQVIDLSGKQSVVAAKIASLLGGSVSSSVPNGEAKSGSEILVILGADFVK